MGTHDGSPSRLTPSQVLALQRSAGNARLLPFLAPARATVAPAPLARKNDARTPLPGWGDPVVGDDESIAAFDPSGSYWRHGAGAGPPAVASFGEDDGFTGALTIRGSGEVRLVVESDFTIDELEDVVVTHLFSARWRIASLNKWGDLRIEKGSVAQGQTRGDGNMAKEVQITALETEEQRNAVTLKATFTGSSITKEGRLPPTRDKTFAAPTKTVSFKLWIVMEGATLGPRPGPYRLHPHTIYYDEGRYLLNAPQVVALADFLKSYPGAYDSLRDSDAADDQGRVKITAFASPKGRPQDNLDLADNRAREVRKRLEQLGVRHANIADPFTPGELGGKGTGEPAGNDAIRSEQRVEIVLPERRVDE